MTEKKQRRGFALLSAAKKKEISAQGGRAALEKHGREHYQRIGAIGGSRGRRAAPRFDVDIDGNYLGTAP